MAPPVTFRVTENSGGLVSAQSVVGHFGIGLPLIAPFGVECRSPANRQYKVAFTFNNLLISVDSVATSCGSVIGSTIAGSDAHQFIVNLATAAGCNTQDITVTLTGVHDDQGNTLTSASATIGLLIGDVSGNGVVDQGDVNLTKDDVGQKATSDNFREDVDVSGRIDALDVFLVKTQVGDMLPP
jgi:hypothetical protein